MRIGIIGAGKVGCSMGKYMVEHGLCLVGYYSRSYSSTKAAAEFTGTKAFEQIKDLIMASDTLFIATPDGEIAKIWDCIVQYDIQEKVISHFSGSLSSDVFSFIEERGAYGCSLHPIYAFSDKNTSYKQLNQAYFTLEGHDQACRSMSMILEALGNPYSCIASEKKVLYHCAASMVSNHVLGVLHGGLALMEQCGFTREEAVEALAPLIINNVQNGLSMGTVEALTGPIERGDVETVRHHLAALDHGYKQMYRGIALELVDMAKEKHPERDYQLLLECLKQIEYGG